MKRAQKKELSPRARKMIFIVGAILLCIFVGAMIFFGQNRGAKSPENAPNAPKEAPVQAPTETSDPEAPEGVDEGNDSDFTTTGEGTGGGSEGVLNETDTSKQLPKQDEIYTATQTAESGMWELLNYDDSTNSKERENTLKAFFAPNTPVNLKLPSKAERLKATDGIPTEMSAYFDAKNGQGGTTADYRVELVGSKQEVMKLPKKGPISKENSNGFNQIKKKDTRWIVSMRQIAKKGDKDKSWVIWNYSETSM